MWTYDPEVWPRPRYTSHWKPVPRQQGKVLFEIVSLCSFACAMIHTVLVRRAAVLHTNYALGYPIFQPENGQERRI